MQKFLIRSLFLVLLLGAAKRWALPPCPGSYENNTWDNCQGTLSLPLGATYVGEWKDRLPHGQGTLTAKQLYKPPTLKMSPIAYLYEGPGMVSDLGVDKTIDTFVPLTTLRRLGKPGITKAKASEDS